MTASHLAAMLRRQGRRMLRTAAKASPWRPRWHSKAAEARPGTLPVPAEAYEAWIRDCEAASPMEQAVPPETGAAAAAGHRGGDMRVSFLLADAQDPVAVSATLRSLQALPCRNWELLMPAPALPFPEAERIVAVADPDAGSDDRGIALNALLARAGGSWVAVLDAGDRVAGQALHHARRALAAAPDAIVLYADQDEIDATGRRSAPLFKPAFSPELLLAFNYFGRLSFLSRQHAIAEGGFLRGQGAGAEWSLHLRLAQAAIEAGLRVERIPRVLCHRPAGHRPDRPPPGTAAAVQQSEALRAHLGAQGIAAEVEARPDGTQRAAWQPSRYPPVSVIITGDSAASQLPACLRSVLERTAYPDFEVLVPLRAGDEAGRDPDIAETPPNVRILPVGPDWNQARIRNVAAAKARSELLLFLEDRVEALHPAWIGELVRMASLPGVGVVGTELRGPDGATGHAGVVLGAGLTGLRAAGASEPGAEPFGPLDCTRNCTAVAAACQMVRRDAFDLAGGFDESYRTADCAIAFCLKLPRLGWRVAYTPFAALRYHGAPADAAPAGRDLARLAREVRRLGLTEDPFWHPALSGAPGAPRLRAPGEPTHAELLRQEIEKRLPMAGQPEAPIDLGAINELAEAAGFDALLWPGQPVSAIRDRWAAARWIIDLLRGRPDLRRRFPRALSEGAAGGFARWLTGEGGQALRLPEEAGGHVAAAFAMPPGDRARQYYFWRDDVRKAFPLALLPAGRRGFATWLFRHGGEGDIRLEEIWWLLMACAEDPGAELVRSYAFTPEWQEAHPDGLTIFGRDAFAVWLSEFYGVPGDAAWLDPALWPVGLTPVEQIRIAHAARPEWRDVHPDAFASTASARHLLAWLRDHAALSPRIRSWCGERLDDGTAARLADPGANIIGHFCYPSGLRVSVAALAEAVEAAGGQVTRRDVRTDPRDDPHHARFAGFEPHDVTIIHVQPEPFFERVFDRADLAERRPRTYRIAYWYWELEAAPAGWAETALLADEIWTATRFVAEAVRQVTPVPVHTLFPGVRLKPFTPRSRRAFGLPGREDGRFAFLFAFHMSSVMERKNPLGLIAAFRQAFGPEEPVDLILKVSSFGRFDAEVEALRAAAAGTNTIIIDQTFSDEEMLALMDGCDAFVSLHRSEGLGLGMAEAMLLGKPVIATRYSGNLDFMDDRNSLLVDFELCRSDRPVPPYGEAVLWADPSCAHAARLMRQVYDDPAAARALGAAAKRDAALRFAPAAAGVRVRQRLSEIAARRRRR